MTTDTDATRRRWGLMAVAGVAGAAVITVGIRASVTAPEIAGGVTVAAGSSAARPGDPMGPLVVEPFAGADPARLPVDAGQRWSLELADLVVTDRTRLYVDGARTVLALLDRSSPADEGAAVVVAVDAATGSERWRAPFERDTGSLRVLGVLDDVAMIERLHPDDRAIVGIDVETGRELWDRPVTEPGLNRVLDGTPLVTRIGVSGDGGLVFIEPRSGDEVGRVDGVLFSSDLLGRWYVRDGDSLAELDLREGWSPPRDFVRLAVPDATASTVVDRRLLEADGTRLKVAEAGDAVPTVFELRELGPLASIRGLFPMVGSTFVLTTDTETYGAVLEDRGVELRWQADGRVVNTFATDRGLALLTASAAGTNLRVIDASTGATITPVDLEPAVIDSLRVVANGVVVERPGAIGVERVGLDLDGDTQWTLIGSGPVAVGDELVAVFAPSADGVRIVGYGTGRPTPGE